MPPTHCPACDGKVSSDASSCFRCGAVLDPDADRTRRILVKAYNIGCLLVLALLTGAFFFWLAGVLT
jgi:predicted nucleic acid-binding Zn ribbon protein